MHCSTRQAFKPTILVKITNQIGLLSAASSRQTAVCIKTERVCTHPVSTAGKSTRLVLERVEILRGPGSALYGQTPPGGVINVISKRPQFDGGSGQFAIEYGTDDRKQISLDVNTEVNDKMAFRPYKRLVVKMVVVSMV